MRNRENAVSAERNPQNQTLYLTVDFGDSLLLLVGRLLVLVLRLACRELALSDQSQNRFQTSRSLVCRRQEMGH